MVAFDQWLDANEWQVPFVWERQFCVDVCDSLACYHKNNNDNVVMANSPIFRYNFFIHHDFLSVKPWFVPIKDELRFSLNNVEDYFGSSPSGSKPSPCSAVVTIAWF